MSSIPPTGENMRQQTDTGFLSGYGSFFKAVLVTALLIATIVGVGHLFGVFGSVATAPGRVINKTLETDNIILSYERFHDLNAGFNARLAQAKSHKTLLAQETDQGEKRRLRVELSAMQQSCREVAEKYNADSEKENHAVFKSKNLPIYLDPKDCE